MKSPSPFATMATALLLFSGCGVLGCSSDPPHDCANHLSPSCGGGGTGGTTGGGGTGGTPVECVPSADHKEIAETCGVFVSSSLGKPDGTGTKDKPFATFEDAIAGRDGKPIYACAEPLSEAVTVASGDVVIYGGLDCTKGWLYDPTKKTVLTAPADKVALTVGKSADVAVSDFEVRAVDATIAGGSSVAVWADTGAALALTRCDVLAGAGAEGAAGEPPSGVAAGGSKGNPGGDACGAASVNGGLSIKNACDGGDPDDDSIGGGGGQGQEVAGTDGSNGLPAGSDNRGIGEGALACTAGTIGDPGADGTDTTGGKGIGALSATGYQGVPGTDGGKGKPGQGGGGGGGAKGGSGANMCANAAMAGGASGGSGGSGGCGGLGGKAGGAAGASIGVASLGAQLTFQQVTITTLAGGKGGAAGDVQDGGPGGDGGDGGKKGAASALKDGCVGGAGGQGGKGGLGGGGQGGPSVGIAFTGTAPDVKDVTFAVGVGGDGGLGSNGSATPALQGDAGLACKTLSFDDGAASCAK